MDMEFEIATYDMHVRYGYSVQCIHFISCVLIPSETRIVANRVGFHCMCFKWLQGYFAIGTE
jgi:hypothetical protein